MLMDLLLLVLDCLMLEVSIDAFRLKVGAVGPEGLLLRMGEVSPKI